MIELPIWIDNFKSIKEQRIDARFLSSGSGKKVWWICQGCGAHRLSRFKDVLKGTGLCNLCFIKERHTLPVPEKRGFKANKACLDCGTDITGSHNNRKRCKLCAAKTANLQSRQAINKWKLNHKELITELHRAYRIKFPIKIRLLHARSIAKSRDIPCEIADEQFIELWNKPCFYCGVSILKETAMGLDRINNDRGYSLDNVEPCCGNCNKIRGDYLTKDEMKVAMTAVLEFRKSLLPKDPI